MDGKRDAALSQANHISEGVNLYLNNAMDIFVKTAEESINNSTDEKFKEFDKAPNKASKYDDLKNEIKYVHEQLANVP